MMLFQNAVRFLSAQSPKARTPMIKFRKGVATTVGDASKAGHGNVVSHAKSPARAPNIPLAATPVLKAKKSAPKHSVLVTELPHRFHRQVISQEEIDYINRGGPA